MAIKRVLAWQILEEMKKRGLSKPQMVSDRAKPNDKSSKINKTIKYVYWQDEEMWLGYLEECPDYWTQAENHDELKENLADLYKELTSGTIPSVRRVAEFEVS